MYLQYYMTTHARNINLSVNTLSYHLVMYARNLEFAMVTVVGSCAGSR